MKKNFKFILPALLPALILLAGCSSSDSSYVLTQYYNAEDCFNAVTTASGTEYVSGTDYAFEYDYTNNVVTVHVTGLSDATAVYPAFKLKNLKWDYIDGWKTTVVNNLTPESNGSGTVPQISTFELRVLDRVLSGNPDPVYYVAFTMSDGTSFVTFPREMRYFGRTIVSAEGTPDFISTESSYVLKLYPDKSEAAIEVDNARFAAAMPVGMNMMFNGIGFSCTRNYVTVNKDNLIPEIGGDPYPAFGISQLAGNFNLVSGMKLNFHCGAMGKDYTVMAECSVIGISK